ncbi:MAG TPA: copper-binding protein [Hyphomicrobiaceae bacterium]|nr:copper-binding protein [Hyphomicrobiaceae bacterium]
MTRIRGLALAACASLMALSGTAALAQSPMVDGEVKKVDAETGKITIKHGPMKKFDMDEGMTMVFKAGDPEMLKQVKPGDKIKFEADKVNGQFTVIKLEKAAPAKKK